MSNVRPLELGTENVVPPTKPRPPAHTSAADTTEAVDKFMETLEHAHKDEIHAIRELILSANPSIAEGIKWNAPSFRTTEYFATAHLRDKNGIGIILHLGAKVREAALGGMPIDDPKGLLRWLAKDRAMIVFKDMRDLNAKKSAFVEVVRSWISYV